MMRRLLAAVVAVAALALTGCSSDPPPPTAPVGGVTLAERQQAVNPPAVDGYSVSIPRLGVRSGLVELGLNGDGSVQTPPLTRPETVGLYKYGPRPGELGPAVLLAHVNGNARPGAFARLAELRAGDVVETDTPSRPVRFSVYRVDTVEKDAFPTAQAYSDSPGPELRLISCGGRYDPATRHYESNVIVWAARVP